MSDQNFSLHPTLAADTNAIADLPLCKLLLSNDASYPWTILVPRRANISEIFQLLAESSAISECLQSVFQPDKLNIAALGNIVPQLHLHHIARFQKDKAWPAPVWGHSAPAPYDPINRQNTMDAIVNWLNTHSNMDVTALTDFAASDV